jgi:hypothetical protein
MNMQKSGANTYNILAFVSILVISYLSLSGPQPDWRATTLSRRKGPLLLRLPLSPGLQEILCNAKVVCSRTYYCYTFKENVNYRIECSGESRSESHFTCGLAASACPLTGSGAAQSAANGVCQAGVTDELEELVRSKFTVEAIEARDKDCKSKEETIECFGEVHIPGIENTRRCDVVSSAQRCTDNNCKRV